MKRKNKIIIILMLIIFFIMFGLVFFDKNRVFDEGIYNFIINFRCAFLDNFFKTITKLGNTSSILVVVIVISLFFHNKNSLLLIISAFDSALVNFILKRVIKRPRPAHLRLISQGGYSFPSGHAMLSICVYGFLLYLSFKIKNKYLRYLLIFIFSFIILAIGISRIYVGVHYPTDVIAGYALAIIEIVFIDEVIRLWGNEKCIMQ